MAGPLSGALSWVMFFLFNIVFVSVPFFIRKKEGRRKEGRKRAAGKEGRKEGSKEESRKEGRKEGRKSDLRSSNGYLEVDLQLGKDYKSLYHNPHIIVPGSVGFKI